MSLARDEVALRVFLVRLTPLEKDAPVEQWTFKTAADAAFRAADAFIDEASRRAKVAALSPAPVPAATVPTPYAPKVGDVVRSADGRVGVIKCRTSPSIFPGWDILPLGKRDPMWALSRVPDDRMGEWTYEGPATAAERAAAGLSVDAAQQPTPAYPVDAAGRPLWVRVTALNGHRPAAPLLTVGRIYKVTGWSSVGCPSVTTDYGQDGWWLSRKGNAPDPECPKYPSWEPCAAPAETPAIAPTPALEPRRTVGAVVRSANGAEFIVVLPGLNVEVAEQHLLSDPGVCASACDEDEFVRWATRAECARHVVPFVDRTTPAAAQDAGLTEAERVEFAELIYSAFKGGTMHLKWEFALDDVRADWLRAADAAAAWFAKRGAK